MDLVRSLPYKIHMGSNSGKTTLGTITTIQDTHGEGQDILREILTIKPRDDHYHTRYTWEYSEDMDTRSLPYKIHMGSNSGRTRIYSAHGLGKGSLPYRIHMGSNSRRTRIYSAHGLGTITTIQDTHGK